MYTVTIPAEIHHDVSRFEPDGRNGVHWDASGWKKRKSSINTISHDAPTVSARFIYGSTTTHDGSATIHHDGATNTHDASSIRCDASMIQASSATVASRPSMNLHDLVVVMRQSQGGGGALIFFFIRRLRASIYHSPKKKSGISSTTKIFEIFAIPKNIPHSVP